jgi:Tol biopolymer transport system component
MSQAVVSCAVGLLLVTGIAGAQERRMDFHPSMSPGGDRVVYYSFRGPQGSEPDVFMTSIATGVETNLSRTPDLWEIEPQWAPAGEQIAFSRGPDMRGLEVTVLDLATGTTTVIDSGVNVAWSPDGRSLAYMKSWKLRVASSTGGDIRHIDLDAIPGMKSDPAWSHDGTSLYFSVQLEEGGPASIHVVSLSSGEASKVLNADGAVLGSPAVSRDGKTLFYGRRKSGERDLTWAYALDGSSAPTPVSVSVAGTQFFPTLSPSGSSILVEGGNWTAGRFDVFEVPLGSADARPRQLTGRPKD